MAKITYPYDPELRDSFHFGEINFESPFVYALARVWSNTANKKIRKYTSRFGNQIRKIDIPISDGYMQACYVIEPEGETHNLPAIVYYHGGAFMFQLQELMFHNADIYASRCNCRVFLPEFRVTPKVNCQVILKDCLESLQYIFDHTAQLRVDAKNIFVYGDSAGGCLAASVAQMCRDRNLGSIKGQLLVYPVMDNRSNSQSMQDYAHAVWSRSANQHMWNLYLKGCAVTPDYAVPMDCNSFSNLPDAYVEVAQLDTLRDEGLAYADKLRQGGAPVTIHEVPGAYHGYDSNYDAVITRNALNQRCKFIDSLKKQI